MAIEHIGAFTHVDDNGVETVLYPVTKAEAVQGLSDAVVDTVDGVAHGTSIHVNDSKEAPCIMNLYGRTEQKTGTGKNLLNCNDFSFPFTLDSTITALPLLAEDGRLLHIALDGTTDERIDIDLGTFNYKANTKYMISTGATGSLSSFAFYIIDENISIYTTKTFTPTSDGTATVKLVIFAGATDLNVKIYPQVEVGTVATEYEPFTNGITPNPTYPEEIEGLTGKNLLKNTATSSESNGITYTVNSDGSVTANGTAIETRVLVINKLTLPKGDYILNGTPSSVYGKGDIRAIIGENKYSDSGSGVSFTVTDSMAEITVQCYVFKGATVSNEKFYPMIRKTSIADGSYVPYGCLQVKACGKNLLTSRETPGTSNGITMTVNKDKSLTFNGTSTARASFPLFKKTLKAGTYVLSQGHISLANSASIHAVYKNNSGDDTYIDLFNDTDGWKLFTLTKDTDVSIKADIRNAGMTISNVTLYPQLELGTVPTTYEPYQENDVILPDSITLNGLNGVSDYIDARRGVIVRKFVAVVFDGSENGWTSSGSVVGRFLFTSSGCAKDSVNAKCTQFTVSKYSTTLQINTFFLSSGHSLGFDTEFTTLAEWKTHLASNPMTVIYELAEPIEEPLSAADILALSELKTFDGVTNVYNDFDTEMDLIYATTVNSAITMENRERMNDLVISSTYKFDFTSLPSGKAGAFSGAIFSPEGYKFLCQVECHAENSSGDHYYSDEVDVKAKAQDIDGNLINIDFWMNNQLNDGLNCKFVATLLFIKK